MLEKVQRGAKFIKGTTFYSLSKRSFIEIMIFGLSNSPRKDITADRISFRISQYFINNLAIHNSSTKPKHDPIL